MSDLYNDYSGYIKNRFGTRVQKISVNTGLTCPNRDGTIGTGGCIYCDNEAFNPAYALSTKAITQQLTEGIKYFSKKYPSQKYIAFFQSYTNTYAPVDIIRKNVEEALAYPGVVGVSLATRPDCISDEILEMLSGFAKKQFIVVEYGVESTLNRTLELINRCHTWEDSIEAIRKTANYGLKTGAHLIIGLPGETEKDFILHAQEISKLPVDFIKMHQLQILSGTQASTLYEKQPELFLTFSVDEYTDVMCDLITYLSPSIIIERFSAESTPGRVIAPKWNQIKNFEITEIVRKKLKERNLIQGMYSNLINS